VAILSALGIYRPEKSLNTTHMDPSRSWVASAIVPFSARLVFELLDCGTEIGPQVRALLNDAVVTLPHPCRVDARHGLCDLDSFIASQGYAKSGAQDEWLRCLAPVTVL
jgi:hypothetical protein